VPEYLVYADFFADEAPDAEGFDRVTERIEQQESPGQTSGLAGYQGQAAPANDKLR
jgi:hypothetical protein